MLSWLLKVIQISGPNFLLGNEILWAIHDVAVHTNHFHLPPFWEHVENSFIMFLLSSSIHVQPLQTLCQFIYTPNTPSATCSSCWYNLRQICALAGIPTPSYKNAVVPVQLPLALLGRWRISIFSLFANLVRLQEAWNADTAEVKAARNKVSRKMA